MLKVCGNNREKYKQMIGLFWLYSSLTFVHELTYQVLITSKFVSKVNNFSINHFLPMSTMITSKYLGKIVFELRYEFETSE